MKRLHEYRLNRHTLDLALNFPFRHGSAFSLYSRTDEYMYRYCRYDGENYEEIVEYLQKGHPYVLIPPACELHVGLVYTINNRGNVTGYSDQQLPGVLAATNFLVRHNLYINMLVNYDIVAYVLAHYKGFAFRAMPEMNCGEDRLYDSLKALDAIPADSFLRTHLTFLAVQHPCRVLVQEIPEEVFTGYINSDLCVDEYVTHTVGDKVGIRLWGISEVVPAEYRGVKLYKRSAFLQNEAGLWAEYALANRCFRSGFVYRDVQVDLDEKTVTAILGAKRVTLHNSHSMPTQVIVPNESVRVGVRQADQWVILPEFDCITLWQDSAYYRVSQGGLVGLYAPDGACLLSCEFDEINGYGTQPELFTVCRDRKWGVVGIGGRCYHAMDIDFEDVESIERAYNEAVISSIREAYVNHRLLPTTVLKTNLLYEYILVGVQTCNLRVKVRRQDLPKELFERCLYDEEEAGELLNRMALYVTEQGKARFDYEKTQRWLQSFKR